ncbi:MAG: hypothetical protein HZB76_07410 [Chlamydiae bacterium]|nr:hypothetical protein [Chlamydiota bacterium]
MQKAGRIGLLLLGAVVLTSFSLYAHEYKKEASQTALTPVIFSEAEGIQWVKECTDQHPEILWLADTNVRKTEEGHATQQKSYSEQLFDKKYIEFDRTVMTIHCLRLILNGSERAYQVFTKGQPKDRLSRESFQALHLQAEQLLKSNWQGLSEQQMGQALETALVLGDIGKSEKARALFKPFGITAPDQDDFYGDVMKIIEEHSELCPSFAHLPASAKKLLIKVANLAHYGHLYHLEGGYAIVSKLKQSNVPATDPNALSFDLLVHTCDVAGALGHKNNQSSLTFTESTYTAMHAMEEAVKILCDPHKTEQDAYNAYLEKRASWLALSSEDTLSRVLTRTGAMLRLFTPADGMILKNAMQQLAEDAQNKIAAQLDVKKEDLIKRTPTYMVALLVNLLDSPQLGTNKEESLTNVIKTGLPFISKVLERHKEQLARNEADPNIPLNFNEIAGVVKTSPNLLNNDFLIDKEGMVHIITE